MEVKLVVVGGKASKRAVVVTLPSIVGRSRDAELTVGHPMVSRRHCELSHRNGLLMVRDLGSLNGTIVDGQRISEAPVGPDDEFTVGPLTFRAEYQYDGDRKDFPPVRLATKHREPDDPPSHVQAPSADSRAKSSNNTFRGAPAPNRDDGQAAPAAAYGDVVPKVAAEAGSSHAAGRDGRASQPAAMSGGQRPAESGRPAQPVAEARGVIRPRSHSDSEDGELNRFLDGLG